MIISSCGVSYASGQPVTQTRNTVRVSVPDKAPADASGEVKMPEVTEDGLKIEKKASSADAAPDVIEKKASTADAVPDLLDSDKKTGASSDEIIFPESGSSIRQSLAARIFDRMRACNDGLEDYTCPIKATAKVRYAFVSVPFNIEGDYFFKQPDKYAVKFTKAPDFLSKYPQAFGWCIPDASKYSIRYFDGEGEFADCFMLRMVPIEGRGDLQKIDMWINRATWMFPRQVYTYKNGGEIDIRCFYRQMESFSLFDRMDITLAFPSMGIKGSGEAVYGEYKINSGLDDGIFKDSVKK